MSRVSLVLRFVGRALPPPPTVLEDSLSESFPSTWIGISFLLAQVDFADPAFRPDRRRFSLRGTGELVGESSEHIEHRGRSCDCEIESRARRKRETLGIVLVVKASYGLRQGKVLDGLRFLCSMQVHTCRDY